MLILVSGVKKGILFIGVIGDNDVVVDLGSSGGSAHRLGEEQVEVHEEEGQWVSVSRDVTIRCRRKGSQDEDQEEDPMKSVGLMMCWVRRRRSSLDRLLKVLEWIIRT